MTARIAFAAVVFAAAAAAHAQMDPEERRLLQEDQQRWADVAREHVRFVPAPAEWIVTPVGGHGAAVAFPCLPAYRQIDRPGLTAHAWTCSHDSLNYAFTRSDLGPDLTGKPEEYFSGSDLGLMASMRAQGNEPVATPRAWLTYGPLDGRETAFSLPGVDLLKQAFLKDGMTYTLFVHGPQGAVNEQARIFFGSFKRPD